MKLSCRPVFVALLAACLYSTGCSAGSSAALSLAGAETSDVAAVPDQDQVEAFTRGAELGFSDYAEGNAAVSDRILDGFEAAPSQVVLAESGRIRWGFKNREANLQSVVISNASGNLKLLAAVDGVTRLTLRSGGAIGDMAEYRQAVDNSGLESTVIAFVHDEADLKNYLPLLKRWMQANLLGFNADCTKPELAQACKLAEQIVVSTTAYVISDDGSLRRVNVPDVKVAAVPLSAFVQ